MMKEKIWGWFFTPLYFVSRSKNGLILIRDTKIPLKKEASCLPQPFLGKNMENVFIVSKI